MSKMTFSYPAKRWKEALPIGDGKTAVMVYGKRGGERLDFNDCTLWSGYPKDYDNAAAKDALPKARAAAFEGKYLLANGIVRGEMYGDYTEAYMPLARVKMSISGDRSQKYRRTLDFDNGEIVVEDGGVRRAAYVSANAGVVHSGIVFENNTISADCGGCYVKDAQVKIKNNIVEGKPRKSRFVRGAKEV